MKRLSYLRLFCDKRGIDALVRLPEDRVMDAELNREVGLAPVTVFAAGAYGIFDIEEVKMALGRPPIHSLQRNAQPATSRGQP